MGYDPPVKVPSAHVYAAGGKLGYRPEHLNNQNIGTTAPNIIL